MSTPWFFLSYSRAGDEEIDRHAREFRDDLVREMRDEAGELKGLSPDEVGFIDATGIGIGDNFEQRLAAELMSCRVLVCLYSDGYFKSTYCGKEFYAFRSRFRSEAEDGAEAEGGAKGALKYLRALTFGSRAPSVEEQRLSQNMLPVLWSSPHSLPKPLPRAVRRIQYETANLGRAYREHGLSIIKREPTMAPAGEYKRLVRLFALRIIEKARGFQEPASGQALRHERIEDAWQERDDPPAAPTNLVATARSTSQIDLKWEHDSRDTDGFEVRRCKGVGCRGVDCKDFVKVTRAATRNRFRDSGLAPGTTYRYCVRAYNEDGDSDFCDPPAEATTKAPVPPFPRARLLLAALALLAVLGGVAGYYRYAHQPKPEPPKPKLLAGEWHHFIDTLQQPSDKWDCPPEWRIVPAELAPTPAEAAAGNSAPTPDTTKSNKGALIVTGDRMGTAHYENLDPVWLDDFKAEFTVRFEQGAKKVSWVLRSQPDRAGGYLFELENSNDVLKLRGWVFEENKRGKELRVTWGDEKLTVTKCYGEGDAFHVEAEVKNFNFDYTFTLETDPPRAPAPGVAPAPRPPCTKAGAPQHTAVFTDDAKTFDWGSFGLLETEPGASMRVDFVRIFPEPRDDASPTHGRNQS